MGSNREAQRMMAAQVRVLGHFAFLFRIKCSATLELDVCSAIEYRRACRRGATEGRFLSRISILIEVGAKGTGKFEEGGGDPQPGTRPEIVAPPHLTTNRGHS